MSLLLAIALLAGEPQEPGACGRAPYDAGDCRPWRTPRALLRELHTDRPDTTESPYTVDRGHAQLEVDAVSAERDEGATELFIATTNFKLGLTSFIDLQLIVEPFRHADGVTGFGDLTLRSKFNVWGDDGGDTAFALMPFVRFPTARRGLGTGRAEAGLVLPLGVQAPLELDVATMLEIDAAYHDDHYGADVLVSCSLAHELWAGLEGYLEVVSSTPLESARETELGLNGGLVLQLGDDAAIDAGTRLGLTAAAPDLALFVGGSIRY